MIKLFGTNELDRLLQPLIYIMNGVIVYQVIFGFLHPFILSHFF